MVLKIIRLPFVIVIAPFAAAGVFIVCFTVSIMDHRAGQEMFNEVFNFKAWKKWIWN